MAKDFGAVIDLDQAANTVSVGMDFTTIDGCSIHVINGAITTTLTLEASNDPVRFPNDWVTVSVVVFEPIAGSPGKQIVEINKMRSQYYRVRAASTSGTGPLRVVVHGKGD